MNNTPAANRLHIGIFGKRNSGKSTLINALTNQEIALVSSEPGTTTDPVYKAMEIAGIGPCMFVDTAGFDDFGPLGEKRIEKTQAVLEKIDIAILVVATEELTYEKEWLDSVKSKKIPYMIVLNHNDSIKSWVEAELGEEVLLIDAKEKINIKKVFDRILELIPSDFENHSIVSHLVKEEDVVMLVMPQDIGAPKGRLILPQVQTTRDLLDHKCTVISITLDQMERALGALKAPPDLIITDSQVFHEVYKRTPKESKLTSFSILFAKYKGDLEEFVKGVRSISSLNENSAVLIAESCTHAPQSEDIGRVKIPKLLKKRFGEKLKIDIVNGNDFPKDLSKYSLVIHCGGCMFSRRHVLSRVNIAKNQQIPITNYGILLAYFNDILDHVVM